MNSSDQTNQQVPGLMLDPGRIRTSAHQMNPSDQINQPVPGFMLDPGRRRTTSVHQMNPSDQSNQPVPGRLSCDGYVGYDIRDYGNRVRKSAEHYAKFRQSWSGPLVAAADDDEVEGEFGFSTTPPVWGPISPSASLLPQTAHRTNYNNNNHYRNLSPDSKAQAIARGQRELMEMVSKMPESCYELSLKDIVEQRPIVEEKEDQEQEQLQSEKRVKKKNNDEKMEIVKKKKKKKKKKNGSVSNDKEGLLLKTVFFLAFGMKNKDKKMKKSELGLYSLKVAPRPPVVEGSDKAVDKEWWKKRFDQQSESESSGSSSNDGSGKSSLSRNSSSSSSSLSRNSSRHGRGGCLSLSFIRKKKSKNVQ